MAIEMLTHVREDAVKDTADSRLIDIYLLESSAP